MIKVCKGIFNPHNGLTYNSTPIVAVDPMNVIGLEKYLQRLIDTDLSNGVSKDLHRDYEFANRLLRVFGFELVLWQVTEHSSFDVVVRPIKPLTNRGL